MLGKIYEGNFLAVLGASGSGKSSVVRAGLLSEIKKGLRRSGTESWEILPVITPTESPLKSLVKAFIPEETIPAGTSYDELTKLIEEHKSKIADFQANLNSQGAQALEELITKYDQTVVLVVDQFEEVFTLCRGSLEKEQERKQFFEVLFTTVDALKGKLRLVITMRADFLGKCLEQTYGNLAERIKTCRVDITPLKDSELDQVICKPAKVFGVNIAENLKDELKQAVKQEQGSLPLLQYALTELWQGWYTEYKAGQTTKEITIDGYKRIGGVEGALEKQANAVYEGFQNDSIKQGLIQRIFLELVQPGEETEDTGRRIYKSELFNDTHKEELVNEVLFKLVEARLVVTDEIKVGIDQQSKPIIYLAHEAIIRHWGKLKEWLNKNRKALPLIQQLRREALKWHKRSIQPEKHLLKGVRLEEAQDCLTQYKDLGYFNQQTEDFITESKRTYTEEETEKEKQILEALRMTSEVYWQEHKQLESLIAIVRAGKRLKETQFSPDNAMQVRSKLHQTLYQRIREKNRLEGHTGSVLSVAFSPNGQMIASASDDNTVKLWDREGQELLTLQSHKDSVRSVAFSPDGQMIASASGDKTVKLWDRKGQVLLTLEGHTGSVYSVTFSPDGQMIASASLDKTVKLWDIQGQELLTLEGHKDSVLSVAFSPDGQMIASASGDKTVKLWDREGQELLTLQSHKDSVRSVAFSPDGQMIASASDDNTVKLWDRKGQELLTLKGHTGSVYSVTFSPDGQMIASASLDKTVKLWDRKGQVLLTLEGHTDYVHSVAFSPDGQMIASASQAKTVKLWDIQGQELRTLKGHTGSVRSVAFSPDGQMIASASLDKTVKLWDIQGQELRTLKGHTNYVYSVAFSPDSQMIASASWDGTVKLWDIQGQELRTLKGHTDYVNSVAFSPDGKMIASASDDRTVKLWDIQGQELLTLEGHTGSVRSVAFSPDGQMIASASQDKTVKLWDRKGQELLTLKGHTNYVYSVAFSPDGQMIASASWDGTVILWNLDLDSPVAKGCEWLRDYLTNNPNVSTSDRKLCEDI